MDIARGGLGIVLCLWGKRVRMVWGVVEEMEMHTGYTVLAGFTGEELAWHSFGFWSFLDVDPGRAILKLQIFEVFPRVVVTCQQPFSLNVLQSCLRSFKVRNKGLNMYHIFFVIIHHTH